MDFLNELPEQMIRDILLRVPYKSQSKVKQLLEPFKETMECFQFYRDRIDFGTSQKYICLIQCCGISIYDPDDQSWELLAPIPTGFSLNLFSQILCINHKIILMGSIIDGDYRDILIYDFLSSTWKQGAKIPTAGSVFQFACCDSSAGLIYAVLGENVNEVREAAVYNVDEDKWELLPEMHENVGICRCVFIEGMLYVIGNFYTRSQRYDPKTREWTTIMDMSFYRSNTWAVDVLYAFGQLIAFGKEGMQKYDWEQNVWTELEAPLERLYCPSATVWGDKIFLCNYHNTSFFDDPIFYMSKPGAAFSERWISFNKPPNFLDRPIWSVVTIEI